MKTFNHITKNKKLIIGLFLFMLSALANAQDSTSTSLSNYCIITTNTGAKVSGVMVANNNGKIKVIDPVLGEVNVAVVKIASMKIAETGKQYTFIMSNGSRCTGTIVRQNTNVITISDESLGEVNLSVNNIVDFGTPNELSEKNSEVFDHASRYLIAPSAIPLRKGEGYYQNVMILMSGAQYGITDNFSMGGGVMVPFGFFATAKYGSQVGKNVHVAAGAMLITTFLGSSYGIGCGFGSLTLGNRGTNLTFTAGYGGIGSGGDWEITKRPILNVSGMLKITDGFSLVTENWMIPQRRYSYNYVNGYYNETVSHTYSPQLSVGFRIGAGKHSFDLAGLAIGGEFVMPYFAYAYRFNTATSKRK